MSEKPKHKMISAYEALVMHIGFMDPILGEGESAEGRITRRRQSPIAVVQEISEFMVTNFPDVKDEFDKHFPFIQETFRRRQMSVNGIFQGVDVEALHALAEEDRFAAIEMFCQAEWDIMRRFGDEFCIESNILKLHLKPKAGQVDTAILPFTRPSGAPVPPAVR